MGYLLHESGEAMCIEGGYSCKLLSAPLIFWDNVTASWIMHFWISTQECSIMVLIDFADCTPQHHGDINLMWLFVQMGMEQPLLYTVNQCCMYMHMFLLSDIVLGVGNYVLPQSWKHFILVEVTVWVAPHGLCFPSCLGTVDTSVNLSPTSQSQSTPGDTWQVAWALESMGVVFPLLDQLPMGNALESMALVWGYPTMHLLKNLGYMGTVKSTHPCHWLN